MPSMALASLFQLDESEDAANVDRLIALDRRLPASDDEVVHNLRIGIMAILARHGDERCMTYFRDVYDRDPDSPTRGRHGPGPIARWPELGLPRSQHPTARGGARQGGAGEIPGSRIRTGGDRVLPPGDTLWPPPPRQWRNARIAVARTLGRAKTGRTGRLLGYRAAGVATMVRSRPSLRSRNQTCRKKMDKIPGPWTTWKRIWPATKDKSGSVEQGRIVYEQARVLQLPRARADRRELWTGTHGPCQTIPET